MPNRHKKTNTKSNHTESILCNASLADCKIFRNRILPKQCYTIITFGQAIIRKIVDYTKYTFSRVIDFENKFCKFCYAKYV